MSDTAQTRDSETPLTDAVVIQFEYEETMFGGEMGGGMKEIVNPDFARALERTCAELRRERDEALNRLQISPFGDDKIDKLESAMAFLRAEIEALTKKLHEAESRADFNEKEYEAADKAEERMADERDAALTAQRTAEARVAELESNLSDRIVDLVNADQKIAELQRYIASTSSERKELP